MRPIEQVHRQILAGNVLDSSGRWIPRTEALKRKRAQLKRVLSGEVKIDGEWIKLSNLDLSKHSMPSPKQATESEHLDELKKAITHSPPIKDNSSSPFSSSSEPAEGNLKVIPPDPVSTDGLSPSRTEGSPAEEDAEHSVTPAHKQTIAIRTIPLGKDTVLTISESRAGNALVAICSIQGFIDQTNADDLNAQIMSMLDFGVKFFIIDFEHTNLIGSAGWGVLAVATRLVKGAQGHLLLCSMSKDIEESFLLLQFNEVIDSRKDISECLDFIDTFISESGNINDHETPKTGAFSFFGESFEDLPLPEKIKSVISRSGPIGFFAIRKQLKSHQYGNTKISIFRLFMLLRELNLESKWKRARFYRSC